MLEAFFVTKNLSVNEAPVVTLGGCAPSRCNQTRKRKKKKSNNNVNHYILFPLFTFFVFGCMRNHLT